MALPHPWMIGTGHAGDTITLYNGSTKLTTTTVGSDGKWITREAYDLPTGMADFYVIATNAAGNSSAQSNHIAIGFNFSTPATPAAPTLTDDSGANIPAGSTTADAHPHINGTGVAGDIIKVYDGSTLIGSTTIGSNGKWSFTPSSDLSKGSHSFNVTETNAAGTSSAHSGSISFTIGTVAAAPPVITGVVDAVGPVQGNVPSGGTTDDPRLTISGTGVVGDTVYVFLANSSNNGGQPYGAGTAYVDASGHWSVKLDKSMPQGLNTITATQFAPGAAQSAASAGWVVTLNTSTPATPAVPTLTDDNGATIPAGSTTADNHPHINGTGTAGNIIRVLDSGILIGSTTVGSNGKWTFTPSNLTDALHSFQVVEVSAAGKTSGISAAISVLVNTAVPATPVINLTADKGTAILAGSTTADIHPHINGTGTAGAIIMVMDSARLIGSTVVGSNGQWSYTPSGLNDGLHGFQAYSVNAAGKISSFSNGIAVTINSSLPAAPATPTLTDDNCATIPAGSTTADAHPHINGSGVAGDIIKVYDGSTLIGSTTIGSNGKWTFTPSAVLSTGSHSVHVVEVNAAGTPSAASDSINIVISMTPQAPVLTAINVNTTGPWGGSGGVASTGYTTDGKPVVTGKGISGDTINVYDGKTLLGTAKVAANGTWSFATPSMLPPGAHSFVATETNAAGQTSSPSSAFAFNTTYVVVTSVKNSSGVNVANGATINGPVTVTAWVDSSYIGGAFNVYEATLGRLAGGAGTMLVPITSNTISFTMNGSNYLNAGSSILSGTYLWGFEVWRADQSMHQLSVYNPNGVTVTDNWSVKSVRADIATAMDDHGALIASGVATTDGAPHLSGTGTADNKIMVTENGVVLGTATIGADGHWVFTPSAALSAGTHSLQMTETDANGAAVKSTVFALNVADTTTQTSADAFSAQAEQHTVVGEHDAFIGKAANGNETVDLNADPSTYFNETTAHIQGSGGTVIDTLHLTGDHQVLDLTSLTGKTATAKISGIEVVDLGGQHNTLKLSLLDVLNLGETDLFQKDGKQQMMVQGKDGDTVDLSNTHIAGLADGEWAAHGTAVVGGVTYNVYEHSGAHTELLVQQGVQIVVH